MAIDRLVDFINAASGVAGLLPGGGSSGVAATSARSYDIDNWSKDFEEGFPRFDPINDELRQRYWGQGRQNRPRFKELNNEGDAQSVEGYRVIEFFPDRDDKDTSTFLMGTPQQIMTQAIIIMAMRQLKLGGGAGGEWIGYPVEDWIQAAALTTVSARIILFPDRFGPLNYQRMLTWGPRQVSIPYVDRSRLTYQALRQACGDRQGLDWGEWNARAYLIAPDGGKTQHQMVASGPTKREAERNLQRFLPFTRCEVRNYSYNQLDYSKGERAKDANKKFRQRLTIYPGHLLILNKEAVPTEALKTDEKGRPTHAGKQKRRPLKFEIWPEREPSGWLGEVKDAFRDRLGKLID
ncbi:MAG: hypothetical protein F6J87_28355 [Spirulina sp. SIO3F2]|nr:hypothetical protein [Spirulina sp. SIO3F2]